jgi:hypothetical protein
MKRITTLTAVASTLFSPFALADHFETLAGYRDAIEISEGEAALVLFVTDTPTVQYQKTGKRPVQFRLGDTRRSYFNNNYHSAYPPRVDKNPSTSQPLALAGPAKISLMTDGVVSIRVVGPEQK